MACEQSPDGVQSEQAMMGLGRRSPPRVLGCPPGQKGRAGRQEGWGPLWPQFRELTTGPGGTGRPVGKP